MPRGERGMCNKSRRRKKNKKEGECGKSRAAVTLNSKIKKSFSANVIIPVILCLANAVIQGLF